jgi:hypothetical protein
MPMSFSRDFVVSIPTRGVLAGALMLCSACAPVPPMSPAKEAAYECQQASMAMPPEDQTLGDQEANARRCQRVPITKESLPP